MCGENTCKVKPCVRKKTLNWKKENKTKKSLKKITGWCKVKTYRKKRQKKNKAEDWKVLQMKNQRDTIGYSHENNYT